MNSRFQLSSGRRVGVHPDGHQHGGSTQSSITLGKSILRVSLKRKNCADLNLGEDLRIFIPFCFPDSGIYLLNSFDFFSLMA